MAEKFPPVRAIFRLRGPVHWKQRPANSANLTVDSLWNSLTRTNQFSVAAC